MLEPWQEYQAVYVHFPFCKQKCLYCDFASYANCTEIEKAQYIKVLCKEIELELDLPIAKTATIYFGGGTPSTLQTEQIDDIVTALKNKGLWNHPKEATIEINPGTVDLSKLRKFHEMGFNRISMGVQSLNAIELHTIGRIHSPEQALEAIDLAKQAGFQHINADVIYGLPYQTLESLQSTLTQLTDTAIDHISVYGLILEENTPLEELVYQDKLKLPDDDVTADMYDFVQEFLKCKGFTRYEISNYYRNNSGSYSHHNDVYWRYYPYLAFGASATSFNDKVRITRPRTVQEYCNWSQALQPDLIPKQSAINDKYNCKIELLSPAERLSEFLIMGLRRSKGVNLVEAQKRYNTNVLEKYKHELRPFFKQKLIDYHNDYLYLTEKGMAIGNQIFEIFV